MHSTGNLGQSKRYEENCNLRKELEVVLKQRDRSAGVPNENEAISGITSAMHSTGNLGQSKRYEENCNLRKELEVVLKQRDRSAGVPNENEADDLPSKYAIQTVQVTEDFNNSDEKNSTNNCHKITFFFLKFLLPSLIVVTVFFVIGFCVNSSTSQVLRSLYGKPLTIKLDQVSGTFGHRADNTMQDCYGGGLKRTFPDVDYAFFGYNVLKGYPLAEGRDPGFTHPIFDIDYSERKQTSDCRYSVPKGLILAPDVSCVTSFSSKVIKDSYQFSKALSTSAQISGGGFGVSFSASMEYKKKTSEMSSGEFVYVFSKAHCNYYFSVLNEIRPPPLSEEFIIKAKGLATEEDIIDFFNYFGTHFSKYVLFGARFVYENKLSKSAFKKESEDSTSMSISAKASFASVFSLGGGFGMSNEQRSAAMKFQQQTETSTISVGAPPPANGDTLTWASTVKDTPVPVQYSLVSIEELFNERYMKKTGIDYTKIKKKIKDAKGKYCEILHKTGEVDSCKAVQSYAIFKGFSVVGSNHYKSNGGLSSDMCITSCSDENKCIAVDYDSSWKSCHFYKPGINNKTVIEVISRRSSILVLFIDNLKILDTSLRMINVRFLAAQARDGSSYVENETSCVKLCRNDGRACIACTFLGGKDKSETNCFLYQQSKTTHIKYERNSVSVIN